MTSRHLNFHEINSRLGLWHYQCPENEKHMGAGDQERIYRCSSAYAVFWHSAIKTVFTMTWLTMAPELGKGYLPNACGVCLTLLGGGGSHLASVVSSSLVRSEYQVQAGSGGSSGGRVISSTTGVCSCILFEQQHCSHSRVSLPGRVTDNSHETLLVPQMTDRCHG